MVAIQWVKCVITICSVNPYEGSPLKKSKSLAFSQKKSKSLALVKIFFVTKAEITYLSSSLSVVIKDIVDGTGGKHAAIVQEVITRKGEFHSCNLVYKTRGTNYKADSLAKFSLSLNLGRHVWLLEPMLL